MSLLSSLGKLLGSAGKGIVNVGKGDVQALGKLLGIGSPPPQQKGPIIDLRPLPPQGASFPALQHSAFQHLALRPQVNAPYPSGPNAVDPKTFGYPPDITYNPNPNVDIPYSAHTLALARLGNQYTANPRGLQFRNIDPGLFGYPPDGPGGVNPNDVYRQPPVGQLQGGAYNPGYTPLQNSGFGGPGYTANIQPANNNPQIRY